MIDDARLEALLGELGNDLDLSPTERRPSPPMPRLLVAAAVVLLVVAAAVFAIAPARRTVGGWLRVGNVELHAENDLAVPAERLPDFVWSGRSIAPSGVGGAVGVAGVGAERFGESSLGEPDAWLAPLDGGALAIWRNGETTLWVVPADIDRSFPFSKVARSDQVTELPDLGDGGLVVDGEHVVETPSRRVGADTVVLWQSGDIVLRLESSLPSDDLVAIARDL